MFFILCLTSIYLGMELPSLTVALRRKEWLPTPVFLFGDFYAQNSLVSYSPWSCKESDITELLTLTLMCARARARTHTHTHTRNPMLNTLRNYFLGQVQHLYPHQQCYEGSNFSTSSTHTWSFLLQPC